MATLTVVVPCHQPSEELAQLVRVLGAQDFLDLVIVDDGSSPPIQEFLSSEGVDTQNLRIFRQANRGPGAARNAGLSFVLTDYVAFLDSDDVPNPDGYLLASRIARAVGADFIRCRCLETLRLGSVDFPSSESSHEPLKPRRTLVPLWGGALRNIYRTDFLRAKGIRFPEELRMGEDLVFSADVARFATAASDVSCVLFAYRRGHSSQATAPTSTAWEDLPVALMLAEESARHMPRPMRRSLCAQLWAYRRSRFSQLESSTRQALRRRLRSEAPGQWERLELSRLDAFRGIAELALGKLALLLDSRFSISSLARLSGAPPRVCR